MAKHPSPAQRAGDRPPAPGPIRAREPDDELRDDQTGGESLDGALAPDAPREDERSLVQRALRKLGLPEGASPLDMARALLGGGMEVRQVGPARARCTLKVSCNDKRLTLREGDLIPEGVDPSTVPAGAFTGALR